MSIERMMKSPSRNTPGASPYSAAKMYGFSRQDSSSALSIASDTYSQLKEKLSSRTPHIKVSRDLKLHSAAWVIGKDEGTCEDFFFTTERGVGVADGVSGWSQYGLNAGDFSKVLMQECHKSIVHSLRGEDKKHKLRNKMSRSMNNFDVLRIIKEEAEDHLSDMEYHDDYISLDPINILTHGFENVDACGSSTATIAVINKHDLVCSNLGDSGFVIIRFNGDDAYTLLRAREQQHSFNVPYQLTNFPGEREFAYLRKEMKTSELLLLKSTLKSRKLCTDHPEDSEMYHVNVQPSDLLVMGSDGLFDNLFMHEILNVCKNFKKNVLMYNKKSAEILAKEIAELAYDASKDKNRRTPFQRKFKKEYNSSWQGGKEDDITVLAAWIY